MLGLDGLEFALELDNVALCGGALLVDVVEFVLQCEHFLCNKEVGEGEGERERENIHACRVILYTHTHAE